VPQFDPANFIPQLVWLAAIFAVLYFFVVRPTLPKVGRVIDAREGKVAGDLDAAESAKGEADAIRTRYDEGMDAARKAAQAEVAAAREAAARASETRLKSLAGVLDGKATEAAERLAGARASAKASLTATAAELTGEAVQRLAGIDVPRAEIEAALAAQDRG
jgi:F-type H+-transporting ATPase subunit b